jgi:3'-phosphoadenosine 5'-phosphosulfate sulfotransferase (PAPS reductase)/FAD synthetase
MAELIITPVVQSLIDAGALFVINDSGGKDSHAMKILMRRHIPHRQLVIIHADLGKVDWEGTLEHIALYAHDIPCHVVRSRRTLLQMVHERGMFPSPKNRQCTSDLKRGPIEKKILELMRGWDTPYIVNCMGMRAQESSSRSKQVNFKHDPKKSIPERVSKKTGLVRQKARVWFDWLPIQHLTKAEVFGTIFGAGEKPHWVYSKGMSRKSCKMCIMSTEADLKTAAVLDPGNYRDYVHAERKTGRTMLMPVKGVQRWLEDVVGISIP